MTETPIRTGGVQQASAHGSIVVPPASLRVANIEKVATAPVQDTDIWVEIFRFRRIDNKDAFVAIQRDVARNPKFVAKALAKFGAAAAGDIGYEQAVADAAFAEPGKTAQLAIRGGWVEARDRFVLPRRVLGPIAGRPIFVACEFDVTQKVQLVAYQGSPLDLYFDLPRKGSLDRWWAGVARPASYSSAAMVAICAAFAAPLLAMTQTTPFTIILTGASSVGKTTATIAAASAMGISSESKMCNWFMTEAGLEQRAEFFSDMLFPIDDLATHHGSAKRQFDLLVDFPYRVTNGTTKHTQTTAKSSITRKPPKKDGVRTIILTSSENSVDHIAAAAGELVPDGTRARLIEIPLPKDAGGIFDGLGDLEQAALVKKAKGLAEEIRRTAISDHGLAMHRFLDRIVREPTKVLESVQAARSEFLQSLRSKNYTALEHRHADRFAQLYAAGALAIQFKLLPWRVTALRKAVAKCHGLSRRRVPNPERDAKQDVERLLRLLDDKRRVPAGRDVTSLQGLIGWHCMSGRDKVCFVPGKIFRHLFPIKARRLLVESEMKRRRILIPAASGLHTKQVAAPHGSGQTLRCYQVRVERSAPKVKRFR